MKKGDVQWEQERKDSENFVCRLDALQMNICVRPFGKQGWQYAVFWQYIGGLYIDWHGHFESLQEAKEKALIHTHTEIESDSYKLLALVKQGDA